MAETKKAVLVTGATGLIGSHLCAKLLMKGEKLNLLCRKGADKSRLEKVIYSFLKDDMNVLSDIRFVEGNICDYYSLLEAMEGVDRVYHCAGIVDFDDSNQKEIMRINSEGTANVVNACLEKGVSLLSHVSSVAVFSDSKNETVTENIFWKSSSTNSAYAISKYNAEREVWRGKEEGLNIIIVNPALVIGPGCYGKGSGELIEQAVKGFPFYTSGSTGIVDVRDVVSCMLLLEEKKHFGQRFILCSENISFKKLFTNLNEAFLKSEPKIGLGYRALRILSYAEKLILVPFGGKRRLSRAAVSSATASKSFSSEKFLAACSHVFIPFEDSIKETCDFYKKNVL